MPSEYGINKHPCFCIRKNKVPKHAKVQEGQDLEAPRKHFDNNDPILFEKLTKKFDNFTAVKELQFSIKEGEVFTFLGHNGAGKTTTIYMLTGMLTSTSGEATVYGYSINKSMEIIQKNLGLCQ